MSLTCDICFDVYISLAPSIRHVAHAVIGRRVQVLPGLEAATTTVTTDAVVARVGPPHEGGLGHALVRGVGPTGRIEWRKSLGGSGFVHEVYVDL